ncbi:MAG TPA: DUF4384 domain-containing protein [Gemmatimonadales bacterium]
MLSVVLLSALATAAPAPVAVQADDPALRIWFNKSENFESGDRIRSYVRTRNDGYLLVLHAEPDGRVRVLFPLDPTDDNFARGGRDYEVRGRGDRQSFTIYESSGLGTVYAAFSRDPFVFDEFVLGDHWDYTLGDWYVTTDTEGELTAVVDRMATGAGFDYDLREYQVGARVVYGGGATYYHTLSLYEPDYYGHHWYGNSGFTIHVGLGSWYGRGYRGWGYGYPVAYWDPWYYDPFYYDPFYYGYPVVYYAPHRPRWGYPRTVVVNQPRHFGGRNYTFKSPNDRFDLTPNRSRTTTRPRATVVRVDNRRDNVSSHGTIPRVVSGRSQPAARPVSTTARRPLTPSDATAPESQPSPTRRVAPTPGTAPSSAARAPTASQPTRRVTPAPAPRGGSATTARPSTGRRTTVTPPAASPSGSTGRRVALPSSSSRSSGSTARRVSPPSGARAMPSRATSGNRVPVRSSQPAARPAPRSSSQGAARSSPPPTRRAAPARSSSRSTSRRRN